MRFTAPLLLSPLLASAIPTNNKPFVLQGDNVDPSGGIAGGKLPLAAEEQGRPDKLSDLIKGASASTEGFSLDLNELRLVQFDEEMPPVWITEMDKIEAKFAGKRFMDITETPTLGFSSLLGPSSAIRYTYPKPGNYSSEIKTVIKGLSLEHMKEFLSQFSGGFKTRYYRSETGRQSQTFLLKTLKEISKDHKGVTIKEFPHSWGQNSIIARFHPSNKKDEDKPVVILGAHQDSTNQWPFLPAPGADDDGSGTTSSIEAFRALCHANYTPTDGPVEFHYFSAEEGGLLGSQAIAKAYEDEGRKVLAMLQMDMTAWVKKGTKESVGIIQDFVDPDLTDFLYKLVEEYLDISPVKTQCSYACSDHASFRKAGYQSAFAIESTFEDSNHNIHTTQDTTDHPEFSFTHMREFSKLCVAFAIELAGIKSSK